MKDRSRDSSGLLPDLCVGPQTAEAALLEYQSLRQEILTRVQLRQQALAAILTLGTAAIAISFRVAGVGLYYPPLGALMALAWSQNDYRIRSAALYLRTYVEPYINAGWEKYMQTQRLRTGHAGWRFTVIAHLGLFLTIQAFAVILGILEPVSRNLRTFDNVDIVLLGCDAVSIAVVVWMARRAF